MVVLNTKWKKDIVLNCVKNIITKKSDEKRNHKKMNEKTICELKERWQKWWGKWGKWNQGRQKRSQLKCGRCQR